MDFGYYKLCPFYTKDNKIDGVVIVYGNSVFKIESSYKLKYTNNLLNFGDLRFYKDDCNSYKDCHKIMMNQMTEEFNND